LDISAARTPSSRAANNAGGRSLSISCHTVSAPDKNIRCEAVTEDAMERDPRLVHAAAHWGPRLTVNGVTCPTFIIAAGLDRLCPPEDARRLAAEISGPVELLVIEDGNHAAHNRAYKYRPQSADWMARELGAA
jgi:pimeloyl-ACP methyl ester carboxylesterase